MFTALASAIVQFCAAITTLFSAAEKGAKALDHLASWSEETAGAFSDEARINRRAKMNALRAKTGVTEEQVSTTAAAPALAAD